MINAGWKLSVSGINPTMRVEATLRLSNASVWVKIDGRNSPIKNMYRHSTAWFSESYWVITKIDLFMLTRGGSFILPVTADSLGWDVTETKAIQVKRWQAWRTSGLQLWRGLIVREKESSWMEADQCENKKGNHRVCHLLLWNMSVSQSHNQIQTTSFFTKYNEESGGKHFAVPSRHITASSVDWAACST